MDIRLRSFKSNPTYWNEFVEAFKSRPILWGIGSNFQKKKLAFLELLPYYQKVNPEATLHCLRQRTTAIRGCFRREYVKVQQAREEGEIYTPTLWYYNHVRFLASAYGKKNKNPKKPETFSDESDEDKHFTPALWYKTRARASRKKKKRNKKSEILSYNATNEGPSLGNSSGKAMSQQLSTSKADSGFQSQYKLDLTHDSFSEEDLISDLEFEAELNEQTQSDNQTTRRPSKTKDPLQFAVQSVSPPLRQPIPASLAYKQAVQQQPATNNVPHSGPSPQICSGEESNIYATSWATSFSHLDATQQIYVKRAIEEVLSLGQLSSLTWDSVKQARQTMDMARSHYTDLEFSQIPMECE